jgi:hypothetical protein
MICPQVPEERPAVVEELRMENGQLEEKITKIEKENYYLREVITNIKIEEADIRKENADVKKESVKKQFSLFLSILCNFFIFHLFVLRLFSVPLMSFLYLF